MQAARSLAPQAPVVSFSLQVRMFTFVLGGRFEGAVELSLSASARAIPVASLMGREHRADSESP